MACIPYWSFWLYMLPPYLYHLFLKITSQMWKALLSWTSHCSFQLYLFIFVSYMHFYMSIPLYNVSTTRGIGNEMKNAYHDQHVRVKIIWEFKVSFPMLVHWNQRDTLTDCYLHLELLYFVSKHSCRLPKLVPKWLFCTGNLTQKTMVSFLSKVGLMRSMTATIYSRRKIRQCCNWHSEKWLLGISYQTKMY